MNKISTFIFVHEQDIVEDYIKHEKFKELSNVKYVFVGNRDCSRLKNNPNVIICNELPFNIENYPKLTSYTGWYAIWKNKLYNPSHHINLLEYDVNISSNFERKVLKNLHCDVIGYIPFSVHDYQFIKHKVWSDILILSMQNNYNINVEDFIDNLPLNKECSMTSNHTFSGNAFEYYMNWIEPLIEDIKHSELSGHQVERSISLFYLTKDFKYKIIKDVLHHFQFDTHKTQGISSDKLKDQYSQLFQ
jgi:hypothetical protein